MKNFGLTEAVALSNLAREIKLLSNYIRTDVESGISKVAREICETYIATEHKGILKLQLPLFSSTALSDGSLFENALKHVVAYSERYDEYCELLTSLGKTKKRQIKPITIDDSELYLLNREQPKREDCHTVESEERMNYIEKMIDHTENELLKLNRRKEKLTQDLNSLRNLKSYIQELQIHNIRIND